MGPAAGGGARLTDNVEPILAARLAQVGETPARLAQVVETPARASRKNAHPGEHVGDMFEQVAEMLTKVSKLWG